MQSVEIDKLAEALSEMQAEILTVKKESTNPFFKSRYADLESCWEAIREALTGHGFAITQTMGYLFEGTQCITTLKTTLMHKSGQWISGEMPLFLPKLDPQAQGSAITYARRYGVAAITGLVQTDDDGNEATTKQGGSQQQAGKSLTQPSTEWKPKVETTPPPPKPVEQKPPVTQNEWESMTRIGTTNGWPDGYINQFVKDRRTKGMADWDIYQAGIDKFSVSNPNQPKEKVGAALGLVDDEELPF